MKKIFLLLFIIISLVTVRAQENFDPASLLKGPPATQKLVNDFGTNTLTPGQLQALEAKLVALDDSSFTQIAVVIIPTTGGREITDYATELGRAWGVGGKEFNNGVILLIAKNDRKISIATGYGLEGNLTDATASYIIDEVIRPNFRGDDYYRGIEQGTDAIMAAVRGTYNTPRERKGKEGGGSPLFIIGIILLILFLSSRGGGGGRGGTFMSRRGYRGLGAPFIFPMLGGGYGGGGRGGGGGGGGGFGGFGGGGFGGGGASGGW